MEGVKAEEGLEGGMKSDRGEQKFARQWRRERERERERGEREGRESEIRNLLSHHDWSHDDRSAAATIAALYRTHIHTQTHTGLRDESQTNAPHKASH